MTYAADPRPPESRLSRVTGSPVALSLNQRILNATTFCAAAAAGLNFIADMLTGQPRAICMISFSAIIVYSLLHLAGRRRVAERAQPLAFVACSMAFVLGVWWVLGDVSGSPLVISMALVGVLPMVLHGRRRIVGLILLGALVTAMALLQTLHPDFRPLMGRDEFLQDTIVTALLLGAGLAALVSLVVLSQQREQEHVEAISRRLSEVNETLAERNRTLDEALREIRTLQGIIPICASCKKIRNDSGYYEALEEYIGRHSHASFTHTLCPECLDTWFPEVADRPPPLET